MVLYDSGVIVYSDTLGRLCTVHVPQRLSLEFERLAFSRRRKSSQFYTATKDVIGDEVSLGYYADADGKRILRESAAALAEYHLLPFHVE